MKSAKRIVSLISSATEILYLLGLGERVVGISHECDFPAEIAGKPRLTRSLVESAASSRAIDDQVRTLAAEQQALYTIDTAALAALAPDLIITQAQCDVCAVRYEDVVSAVRETPALKETRILALNPHSLGDVLDDVERVSEAAGVPEQGRSCRAQLAERVARLRQATAALPRDDFPRVIALEWIDPPMVAANWTPELVEIAGGAPGLAEQGRHSTYARWQEIVDYDPQVVVVMPCGFDLERAVVEAQPLLDLPGWSELSAVHERRVYAVDGNAYFNRSGPRLVDSAEILAHLFHPARFESPVSAPQRAFCRLSLRGNVLVPEEL